MTGYLLDTNVISEVSRTRPHHGVVEWLESRPTTHLSVLTVGELRRGAWRLRARDAYRANRYAGWIDEVIEAHGDRVHVVTQDVVESWAALPAKRTLPVIDSLIAATALTHGLTVATRNVPDFTDAGVAVFNPFD